jgi:hypothetical protein
MPSRRQAVGGAAWPLGMQSKCADCPMRRKAEAEPDRLMSRIWRWHTKWCPGWKAYQRELGQQEG